MSELSQKEREYITRDYFLSEPLRGDLSGALFSITTTADGELSGNLCQLYNMDKY